MSAPTPDWVADFPTLGYLQADWIAWHCPIPDGFHKGEPLVLTDWQLWGTLNHGRVRPNTPWKPENPVKAQAFAYRRSLIVGPQKDGRCAPWRSLIVGPQKAGKSPWGAATGLVMALGPDLFAGWAEGGEKWDCRDYGCGCGFVYEYEPGEPMGMPWPTPLVQFMATSESQVDNMWRPLTSMIRNGPLSERVASGGSFVRIGDEGRIDRVTVSATSRLGNPTTGFLQDETGLYTESNGLRNVAQTMRRGTSAMGGRGVELTNAWDPTEDSTAQQTYEAKAKDIFRLYREPPPTLKYKIKADRQKIHEYVYAGSTHVDLADIEAEAAELLEKDPAKAERFYGNKLVRGAGSWLPDGMWEGAYAGLTAVA